MYCRGVALLMWIVLLGTGCSTQQAALVDEDEIKIEPEPSVVAAKVWRKEGSVFITGTITANPPTDNHLHGLLHIEILDANRKLSEHVDLCFNSIWRKPGYRTPGAYVRPRFKVALAKLPEVGSIVHFRAEWDNPKCRQQHEVGSEIVSDQHA